MSSKIRSTATPAVAPQVVIDHEGQRRVNLNKLLGISGRAAIRDTLHNLDTRNLRQQPLMDWRQVDSPVSDLSKYELRSTADLVISLEVGSDTARLSYRLRETVAETKAGQATQSLHEQAQAVMTAAFGRLHAATVQQQVFEQLQKNVRKNTLMLDSLRQTVTQQMEFQTVVSVRNFQ